MDRINEGSKRVGHTETRGRRRKRCALSTSLIVGTHGSVDSAIGIAISLEVGGTRESNDRLAKGDVRFEGNNLNALLAGIIQEGTKDDRETRGDGRGDGRLGGDRCRRRGRRRVVVTLERDGQVLGSGDTDRLAPGDGGSSGDVGTRAASRSRIALVIGADSTDRITRRGTIGYSIASTSVDSLACSRVGELTKERRVAASFTKFSSPVNRHSRSSRSGNRVDGSGRNRRGRIRDGSVERHLRFVDGTASCRVSTSSLIEAARHIPLGRLRGVVSSAHAILTNIIRTNDTEGIASFRTIKGNINATIRNASTS